MTEIGRVISDQDTPNHLKFKLQLRSDTDVKAGQFVVANGTHRFVGQIIKPWTYSPTFSDPRIIQFHETGTPDIKVLYPSQEWTIADALIVGELESGKLDISGAHPKPGDIVEIADSALLESIFSSGNDILLGELYGHQSASITFGRDELFDHTLIAGKTGSGKTYCGAAILENAIEAGMAVVAVDPHGELGSMATANDNIADCNRLSKLDLEPKGYKTILYAPAEYATGEVRRFTVTAGELSFSDFLALVGLPGDIQQMILLRSIQSLASKHGTDYNLDQLIDEVRRYGASIHREESAETVCLRLRSLTSYGIIGDGIKPDEMVNGGAITILTLPGVDDFMQQIAVSILARKLLRARQRGKVPPFLLYVEEAYLFAPSRGDPPSKDALIKLVRQGRKFGAAVALSTQQPSNVDNRIYAQCHLKVILRLDAYSDLKFVTPWLGPQASYYTQMLPSFPDGRALVSSKYLRRPLIVNVRPRKSKHGGRTAEVIVQEFSPAPVPDASDQLELETNTVPLAKDEIAALLPEDYDSLVLLDLPTGGTIVRGKQWLGKDAWIRINNALSTLGFEWVSDGSKSRWLLSPAHKTSEDR